MINEVKQVPHTSLFTPHGFSKEPADKPGSVVDSHSSGIRVTTYLKQPTREQRGPRQCSPIWSCSEWGLPCHCCYQQRGALLPHHFTLTSSAGGIFSVALSVGSRRPAVSRHPALRSPDFPHARGRAAVRSTPGRHHSR